MITFSINITDKEYKIEATEDAEYIVIDAIQPKELTTLSSGELLYDYIIQFETELESLEWRVILSGVDTSRLDSTQVSYLNSHEAP